MRWTGSSGCRQLGDEASLFPLKLLTKLKWPYWLILAPSWEILRPSWSILEPAMLHHKMILVHLSVVLRKILEIILVHLGFILVLFWAISRPYLGDSLCHLDKKNILRRLGAILAHQPIIGPFWKELCWGHFGPSWGHLQIFFCVILAHLRTILWCIFLYVCFFYIVSYGFPRRRFPISAFGLGLNTYKQSYYHRPGDRQGR